MQCMHFIYSHKYIVNLFNITEYYSENHVYVICLCRGSNFEYTHGSPTHYPLCHKIIVSIQVTSVYITRLQVLHIIYCYRSVLPALLQHLSSHPLPSIHYLYVWCKDESVVRALTTFLPQCTNLRTLQYARGLYSVSESVEEEMWKAAVRRCRNLEEVRVSGKNSAVSCNTRRLVSVLKKLSEREGIQVQKLRRIVRVADYTQKVLEDYTEQVKHLLPALQQ